MIEAKFDVSQTANLLKALKQFPGKVQRKILVQESRKAAKTYLLGQAKNAVPKQTGALRKSIKVRALKRSRVRVGVRIGMAEKDFTGETFYGSFLEYGWRVGKRSAEQLRAQSFFSKAKKRGEASKLGRKRSKKIEAIHSETMRSEDKRRKIPAKYYLKKVVEQHGDNAQSGFANQVAERIESELQSWRI